MLLITLFDDLQAKYFDHGSGYAVAYDFLTNKIVIKHYESESLAGRLPLHEPLLQPSEAADNDGIQMIASPKQIMQGFINDELPKEGDPKRGFALVTLLIAGHWIDRHFDSLRTISQADDDQDARLDDALHDDFAMKLAAYQRYVSELPFPEQIIKVKKDDASEDASARRTYLTALANWDNLKGHFRVRAWKANKAGRRKEAEGLVDVWERVHRVLEERAERPEGEVKWDI